MSTVNHSNMRGLIPVDQSRMIVLRRELTRPNLDVHEVALAQDCVESPPHTCQAPGKTILQKDLRRLVAVLREVLSDRPDKPGQLAGAGDHRRLRRLPPLDQVPILAAQSLLRPLGYRNNVLRTSAAALGQRFRHRVRSPIMPGRLNENPTHMRIPDFGDAASKDPLSGGMLRTDQAGIGHAGR